MSDDTVSYLFRNAEKMLAENEPWTLEQLEEHAQANTLDDVLSLLDASARLALWKRRVELDYPQGNRDQAYRKGLPRVLGKSMAKSRAHEIERLYPLRHRIAEFAAREIKTSVIQNRKPMKAKALTARALWERFAPEVFPAEWAAQEGERAQKKAARRAKRAAKQHANPDLDAADARAAQAQEEAASAHRRAATAEEILKSAETRIAELEAEVHDLRAKLGEPRRDGEPEQEPVRESVPPVSRVPVLVPALRPEAEPQAHDAATRATAAQLRALQMLHDDPENWSSVPSRSKGTLIKAGCVEVAADRLSASLTKQGRSALAGGR